MAHVSKELAMIRSGYLYTAMIRALTDEGIIQFYEDVDFDKKFSELDKKGDLYGLKEKVYNAFRKEYICLPEYGETEQGEFVTLGDMFSFAEETIDNKYGWIDHDLWQFLAAEFTKYSHPEKTRYKYKFKADYVRFDTIPKLAFGTEPGDMKRIAADFEKSEGVPFPKMLDEEDTFDSFVTYGHAVVNHFEGSEKYIQGTAKWESASMNYSCLQTLGYAFLLYVLPLLIFAGILALIFSHIY
ncbi:MAG: hypothetical protein LUF29_02420 [Oscillospiraceae bacterium]|nr:hypothetical protein [Oscillospiraceae bacterium]